MRFSLVRLWLSVSSPLKARSVCEQRTSLCTCVTYLSLCPTPVFAFVLLLRLRRGACGPLGADRCALRKGERRGKGREGKRSPPQRTTANAHAHTERCVSRQCMSGTGLPPWCSPSRLSFRARCTIRPLRARRATDRQGNTTTPQRTGKENASGQGDKGGGWCVLLVHARGTRPWRRSVLVRGLTDTALHSTAQRRRKLTRVCCV
jgi:hypothetical protein